MSTLSLTELIAEVLQIPPDRLDKDSGLNVTENWDSLNQFMITSAIEREFGVRFVFADMQELATVRALRDMLRQQGIAFAD